MVEPGPGGGSRSLPHERPSACSVATARARPPGIVALNCRYGTGRGRLAPEGAWRARRGVSGGRLSASFGYGPFALQVEDVRPDAVCGPLRRCALIVRLRAGMRVTRSCRPGCDRAVSRPCLNSLDRRRTRGEGPGNGIAAEDGRSRAAAGNAGAAARAPGARACRPRHACGFLAAPSGRWAWQLGRTEDAGRS